MFEDFFNFAVGLVVGSILAIVWLISEYTSDAISKCDRITAETGLATYYDEKAVKCKIVIKGKELSILEYLKEE